MCKKEIQVINTNKTAIYLFPKSSFNKTLSKSSFLFMYHQIPIELVSNVKRIKASDLCERNQNGRRFLFRHFDHYKNIMF